MARDVSVATLEELEPGNFFPLSLGSEELRGHALLGIVASWGMRRPFYIRQNGILSVLCGRFDDVREVYGDSERFSVIAPKRPGYELFDMFGGLESVLQMDGERHTRVRRLMNPSFMPAAIEVLKADIHRILGEKLDYIEKIGPCFDAMSDFSGDLMQRIMLEASFKLTPDQRAAFARMYEEMAKLPSYTAGQGVPQSFLDASANVRSAIDDVIRVRRANPGPDLISNLIRAHEAGDQLNDNELFGQINSIATAGIGSSANTLAGALMLLGRHPDQLARLKAEPHLIDTAVEECLRHHGPGILSFVRFATRDTRIAGTRIPKDMPVYVSPQAAGFDPTAIEDPFRFDIGRKNRSPLVFGAGIHNCIGQRLARFVLKIAISKTLARFPGLRIADPEFIPVYRGLTGELQAISIPMRTC